MNKKLFELPSGLKKLLAAYLLTLAFGVLVGLAYLYYTTSYSSKGVVERFKGSEIEEYSDSVDEIEMEMNYKKSLSEMLMTTHNHILGLSFIFLTVGLIFYFNSITSQFWKMFLLIEPFVSLVISFTSIWGVRFIDGVFVYITFISALLMYSSLYIMIFISLKDLLRKTSSN